MKAANAIAYQNNITPKHNNDPTVSSSCKGVQGLGRCHEIWERVSTLLGMVDATHNNGTHHFDDSSRGFAVKVHESGHRLATDGMHTQTFRSKGITRPPDQVPFKVSLNIGQMSRMCC